MKPIKNWPYRGAKLGSGWFPEEPEEEYKVLAKDLLKGLLDSIWETYRKNRAERQNA